jgi:hypothetical protein
LLRRVAIVSVAALVCSLPAQAIRPPPGRAVTARATARNAPPARPAPRVALQLSGLRVSEGVRMRAFLHAIARDAWPQLVSCARDASARGVVRVFLEASGRAMRVTELSGGPVSRDAALRQCVQSTVERIHPPASEVAPLTASFELSFDMPAL